MKFVKIRSFLRCVGGVIFPKKCVICKGIISDGELCANCRSIYERSIDPPCPVCSKVLHLCHCRDWGFTFSAEYTSLGFYTDHQSVSGKMVYTLKRRYNRELVRLFSRSLSAKLIRDLGKNISGYELTYAPRSRDALDKYGFDHAAELAKCMSEYLDVPYCDALLRIGGKAQKSLDSRERQENAEKSLAISNDAEIEGKRFILIDDLVTTGATVESCAELLLRAGAKEVYPAFLFRTAPKKRDTAESDNGKLWFQ